MRSTWNRSYKGWQKENVQEFGVNLKENQLLFRQLIVMGMSDNMGMGSARCKDISYVLGKVFGVFIGEGTHEET